MLKTKFISSMEKCFLDSNYDDFAEIEKVNIYKNTDASFQFLAFDYTRKSSAAKATETAIILSQRFKNSTVGNRTNKFTVLFISVRRNFR